jgi:hypothetical protein
MMLRIGGIILIIPWLNSSGRGMIIFHPDKYTHRGQGALSYSCFQDFAAQPHCSARSKPEISWGFRNCPCHWWSELLPEIERSGSKKNLVRMNHLYPTVALYILYILKTS